MRIFLITSLLLVSTNLVFAKTIVTNNNTVVNPTAVVVNDKNLFGPMVDAPKLVRIYGDWYMGAEGGKDIAYTNTSKGWFAYGKVTYTGTLFTIFKSKQEAND
jgi:hypothetical protein